MKIYIRGRKVTKGFVIFIIVELIFLAGVAYMSYDMFTQFKPYPKEEMTLVEGKLTDYETTDDIRNWRHHGQFWIYVDGKAYRIGTVSYDKFDKIRFINGCKLNDRLTLLVDEKNQFSSVAEIWSEGVCYWSYEEYIEVETKNQTGLRWIGAVFLPFWTGVAVYLAYGVWTGKIDANGRVRNRK